jgi:hypothetical protein
MLLGWAPRRLVLPRGLEIGLALTVKQRPLGLKALG